MTLTLTPETEAYLTAAATRRGLPPEDTLAQILAEESRRLADAQADFDEAVADIRVSLSDFAAGRSLSLEELRAHTDAVIEAKRREAGQEPSRVKTRA